LIRCDFDSRVAAPRTTSANFKRRPINLDPAGGVNIDAIISEGFTPSFVVSTTGGVTLERGVAAGDWI
jgi:hypothetical protein